MSVSVSRWMWILLVIIPTLCRAQTYDFGIAVGTDDGRVYQNGNGLGVTYPPIAPSFVDTTTPFFSPARTGPSGNWTVEIDEARWNTGPILSGQVVNSASLVMFFVSTLHADADITNLNGAWVADSAIVAGDYTEAASTAVTAFSVLLSDLCTAGSCTYCTSGLCTIPLSNVSSISTTPGTYTKIRLTMSQRPGDAAPTGSNNVAFESFEHSSPQQSPAGPHLVVQYGNTPTPTNTATPIASSTPVPTNTPNVTPTRLPTFTGGTPPRCGEVSH